MKSSHIAAVAMTVVLLSGARAAPDSAATDAARQLIGSGIAHERAGQNEEALLDFTKALDSGALSRDDRVRAVFDRGVALDALGRTYDAIGDYSAAIRLDPTFAPAFNNRANAYRRLGRLAEAKRDYLAALMKPGASLEYTYFGLGQIAEKQGDAVSARTYYRKALAANPNYATASQSLAALGSGGTEASAVETPSQPETRVHQSFGPAAADNADVSLRQGIVDTGAKMTAGGTQVQLGAFHSRAAAMEAFSRIDKSTSGSLHGLKPVAAPVDVPGKGQLWRLRVGVKDTASARQLCTSLTSRGMACFVPTR